MKGVHYIIKSSLAIEYLSIDAANSRQFDGTTNHGNTQETALDRDIAIRAIRIVGRKG